ncbi:MAG: hypothetical protein IT244_02260, partial [Bacteroidia bacterium]|nr:hypothetical protein [Bacteroidia bacterium]
GYDECIATYDAPSTYTNGYKGEKHLRDDELGNWVKKIRAAVGPTGDVVVVADACHSGTALRGPVTRGNKGALAPPDFNPLNKIKVEDPGAVDAFVAEDEEMAPVVLFSASRAHEPNQEYKGYGSLSLAISQALNTLKPGDSYLKLFSQIQCTMTSMDLSQVPVLEGNANRSLFGGKEIKQSNYYPVKFVLSSEAQIAGGTLSGLYKGSKVAFMPAGSTEYIADKAIFTTTISSASMSTGWVEHNGELNGYNGSQLWCFVLEQQFGAAKLNLTLGNNIKGNVKGKIKDNISKLEFINWNDKEADLVVDYCNNNYALYLPDGRRPFDSVPNFETLNKQLAEYMQGKMMINANFSDPNLNVDVTFSIQHMNGRDNDGMPLLADVDMAKKMINGNYELEVDDVVFMTITNSGMKDAYINILEINPAGKVEVVVPNYALNEQPADYLIPAGATRDITDFARRFTGPYFGKYTFKIFITEVPVSFRHIFNTRGAGGTEEQEHPAAKLFSYSYKTTRGEPLYVKKASGGGTTKEYIFRMK